MGWGGLPEHVVEDELASGALVVLQVPELEADTMELFAMRRRDRPHGVVAQALWEELRRSREEFAVPNPISGRPSPPRPDVRGSAGGGELERPALIVRRLPRRGLT